MKTKAKYTEECRKRKEESGLVALRIPERWVKKEQHDSLKEEIMKFIDGKISKK